MSAATAPSTATVHVSDLASSTTEAGLRELFSFCGTISSVTLDAKNHTAVVTFEKPSAASTAAMLHGTTLDSSVISVSQPGGAPAASAAAAGDVASDPAAASAGVSLSQEDKPRTAVVAEVLSSGYAVTEDVMRRAVAFDQQHGFSARFRAYLDRIDRMIGSRVHLHHPQAAAGADKADVKEQTPAAAAAPTTSTEKAEVGAGDKEGATAAGAQPLSKQLQQTIEDVLARPEVKSRTELAMTKFSEYWNKAANQPTIHAAYTKASRGVSDIHEEAKRLAAEKRASKTQV